MRRRKALVSDVGTSVEASPRKRSKRNVWGKPPPVAAVAAPVAAPFELPCTALDAAATLESERTALLHDILGPVDGAKLFAAVLHEPERYAGDKRPFMKRLVAAVRAAAATATATVAASPSAVPAALFGWLECELSEQSMASERCLQTLTAISHGGRRGITLSTRFAVVEGKEHACVMGATVQRTAVSMSVSAVAKTKKAAKRSAAIKMLLWMRAQQTVERKAKARVVTVVVTKEAKATQKAASSSSTPPPSSSATETEPPTAPLMAPPSAALLQAVASPVVPPSRAVSVDDDAAASVSDSSDGVPVAVTLRGMLAGSATFVIDVDSDEPADPWAVKKTSRGGRRGAGRGGGRRDRRNGGGRRADRRGGGGKKSRIS